MLLRDAIKTVHGLGYMVERLDIQSSIGRRMLLDSELVTEKKSLEHILGEVEWLCAVLQKPQVADIIDTLKIKLSQVRDVSGTIAKLSGSLTLDDVELFEIKHLCILSADIAKVLTSANIATIQLPSLEQAIQILDPEGQRVPHFYIYDAYSKELAELRRQLASVKTKLSRVEEQNNNEQTTRAEELYYRSVELEDGIRAALSEQLQPYAKLMDEALNGIARLDIILAKAVQALVMGLVKPLVATSKTVLNGLFNPQVKEALENNAKHFQPVDIAIEQSPILITGANMSGKTVLLKTICLAQHLFQFGFYVPAKKAELNIVEAIMISLDDGQEELKGLSSFASEMLDLNEMLREVKQGKQLLLLIDELARTTNPTEGKAIVNATLDMLFEHGVQSIITTHYSGIVSSCRKLRVKGFVEDRVKGSLSKKNIEEYIDYSLIEDKEADVPMEAIRVARMLGVDDELLDKAKWHAEHTI